MSRRAISTVLDVSLCLVLVSASVLTVVQAPSERPLEEEDGVGATATMLSTTTAQVNYSLAPGANRANEGAGTFPRTEGEAFERTAHGTLAGLLADAVMANVTVQDEKLTHFDDEFQRSVSEAVRRTTDRQTENVHIVARWQPYPDSHIAARVSVGERPLPTADVHAAKLTAPSGVSSVRSRAHSAARTAGFSGVAHAFARAIVNGLFPPADVQLGLQSEYPGPAFARYEYRRAFSRYGATFPADVAVDNVDEANRQLTREMARSVESELRRRFDSPSAAANASAVDRVHIVVRTWSA